VQLNNIIGQQHLKEQLVSMVQQNRLGHALLFLGKEGSGALPMALAFAQYLVCENASENNDSCGTCSACVKAGKLIHPDIHYSYPVITSKEFDKPISTNFIVKWREFIEKQPYGNLYDWLQFIEAENKQGNISRNECDEISKKMSLKSFESRYKMLIMWMPEMLGDQGNKLLKLIEEPPADTLFILVAENDKLILPTILSRTQLIKFAPLNKKDIAVALEKNEGLTAQKAEVVAAVSDGNYREALLQIQHSEDDWESMLRSWMNAILKGGPVAQIQWIDEMSKLGREKQKQFLKYFIHLIENAIKISVVGVSDNAENTEKQQALNDFALRLNKLCGIEQLEAIVKEIDLSSYHIERNANAKILFHALTIKIYHIISNKSVILIN
jgi:DNA polymerase-3 subunit delta'